MKDLGIIDKLPKIRGKYRQNCAIKNWFAVGGNAEVLFKPKDHDDLAFFLKNRPVDVELYVIGAGSNVIISDKGLKGVLIRPGAEFAKISYQKGSIKAGCAALCVNLVQFCKENSLAGLEFFSGIPGSVGGAVAMNAGCYGDETALVLSKVKAIDYDGNIKDFDVSEIAFDYRKNPLANEYIFLEAIFDVVKGKSQDIVRKIEKLCAERQSSQPIRAKTGGSTFKNPNSDSSNNLKAWQLIDKVGCRGKRIGDAMISDKHCNFMVNVNNAKAQDLVNLGELALEKVKREFGLTLEWEVVRFGDFD